MLVKAVVGATDLEDHIAADQQAADRGAVTAVAEGQPSAFGVEPRPSRKARAGTTRRPAHLAPFQLRQSRARPQTSVATRGIPEGAHLSGEVRRPPDVVGIEEGDQSPR